jgi:DNA polymerase
VPNTVVIDFETRSPTNIKSQGMYVYAENPYTEPACLCAARNQDPPVGWMPDKFQELIDPGNLVRKLIPEKQIIDMILSADIIVAQNSMFEFLIWNWIMGPRKGWPELPLEKLHDTMAQLGYHSLPLSLDHAGRVLRLPIQKDKAGHRIMLKLCKPRTLKKAEKIKRLQAGHTPSKNGWVTPEGALYYDWHEGPRDIEAQFNYCCTDVETERLVYQSLAPLPPAEREIWLVDQKINLRGIPIDVDGIRSVVELIDELKENLLTEFESLVRGEVSSPLSPLALRKWVEARIGRTLDSMDKYVVADLLEGGNLPVEVEQVLKIKQKLSKASVSKLTAMLNHVNSDGRVRGAFQYGAANTTRWGGRAVQPQNLPRDSYYPDRWRHVVELFRKKDAEGIELLFGSPFFAASRCVRGAICTPPDRRWVCADYTSIEGVGGGYLAEEETALEIYRNGKSPYIHAAMSIFNVGYDQVTPVQRQVGKVCELAFGYAGGIGACANFANVYGVDLEDLARIIVPTATEDELDGQYKAKAMAKRYLSQHPGEMSYWAAIACDVIKQRWRVNRPKTVHAWRDVAHAAISAVQNPGQTFSAGRFQYAMHGSFLKTLMPSGRTMQYFQPQVERIESDFGDKMGLTYWGMKSDEGNTSRKWIKIITHGGKLWENNVQAFCRDILAAALVRCETYGYPVGLHVHDEPAAEMPNGVGSLEDFIKIITVIPPWAAGMPIAADGWEGRHYRKS